jgi:hypothetical protein
MTITDIEEIIGKALVEDCLATHSVTTGKLDDKQYRLVLETKRGQKFVIDIREE